MIMYNYNHKIATITNDEDLFIANHPETYIYSWLIKDKQLELTFKWRNYADFR